MKKVLSLILVAAMVLTLAACGGSAPANNTAAPSNNTNTEPAKTYVIGISQYAQHPALDAATKGFKDTLVKALGEANVTFIEENASGSQDNLSQIATTLVSKNVDLILANATPCLTSVAAATNTIPILGTAVTEYGTALEIADFNGTVGGNISGTSDLANLEEQAKMLMAWFPEAKNVGLLFCSAEANSRYQVDEVAKVLKANNINVTEYAFTDSSDINTVTQKAADNCDVIYVPTDNAAADNTEAIANIVLPKKVPVVAGEEGICKGCGVCTLSISYYDLGVTTGEMAVKILTEGADISTMPIAYTTTTPKYNAENCQKLGLTAPEGYVAIE